MLVAKGVAEAVTLANKEAHFTHLITNRFDITQIARLGTLNTQGDGSGSLTIPQLPEPLIKCLGRDHVVFHCLIVAYRLHNRKQRMSVGKFHRVTENRPNADRRPLNQQ